MNGASNTPAPDESEAGADTGDSLASDVREIAAHLQHVATLATSAVDGDEPERGARHLLDVRVELAPLLHALAVRLGSVAVALSLA
jgi:hypothetical protein